MAGLHGKVVFVTGGSRGIGAAIARGAAARGAAVAISYRTRADDAGRVAADIERRGGRCHVVAMDITDRAQIDAAMSQVRSTYGRLDGLVNNAGVMGRRNFAEMTPADWAAMIDGSLTGVFHCIQSALPALGASAPSSIVNIASRLGQVGGSGFVHYAAAKAGVLGMTRALALELIPQGVRVNAVAPAVVLTEERRAAAPQEKLRETPLGRFAEPEEVAAAVLFLLSDDAAQFVGQTLNPNGGAYMP